MEFSVCVKGAPLRLAGLLPNYLGAANYAQQVRYVLKIMTVIDLAFFPQKINSLLWYTKNKHIFLYANWFPPSRRYLLGRERAQ